MTISMKAARVNAGLTQQEAANALNVDRTTIVNWESGKTMPNLPKFYDLCKLYGTSVDDIFLPNKSTLSRKKANREKNLENLLAYEED